MPLGILTNVAAVAIGGLGGSLFSKHISRQITAALTLVFGLCALANGIFSVAKASSMPVIFLSVILGALIGEAIQLERLVTQMFSAALSRLPFGKSKIDMKLFVTVSVIFCASGFGVYGAMMEGLNGDATFLLSKAVLDLFSAIIFSATLGAAVGFIAIPQILVLLSFFFLGQWAGPLLSPDQMLNFTACGGVLTIAAGLTVAEIKAFSLANLLPALVLVFPITWFYYLIF